MCFFKVLDIIILIILLHKLHNVPTERMCFYPGKNALSLLAFSLWEKSKFVWQQSELCIFRCAASAAHFLFGVEKRMKVSMSKAERIFRPIVQRYNHEKYWKYRSIVTDPNRGTRFGDLLRLFYIKRADAFCNASMGTHRNFGATFETPPNLPHNLNGIIVSHNAVIGKNCTIFHQVTIGEGRGGAPVIGDNVFIGAGAKLIGHIKIGNNVKIGAGAVVACDVPDDATVVIDKPRIIL